MKFLLIFIFIFSFLHSKELEKVYFQFTWKIDFTAAGYIIAKEKGFYKDFGLDTQIKTYETRNNLYEDLKTGKTTYSSISSDYQLLQYQGKDIVPIASYLKRNILVLLVKPHIKDISDLKKYKIITSKNIFNTSLFVLLKQQGLKKEDINIFKKNYSTYLEDFISNDEIAATTAFLTNEAYYLKKAGIKFKVINPAEYGIYTYGLNLISTKEEATKNYTRAKRFLDATNKGWEYAFEHKEETIDILYDKYNSYKEKDALLYEAKELENIFQRNIYKLGEVIQELQEVNLKRIKKLGLVEEKWEPDNFIFQEEKKLSESEIQIKLFYAFLILFSLFLLIILFYYKNRKLKKRTFDLQNRINKEIKKTKRQSSLLVEQNKMASMGEMIDNIAHQWRQPLSQINAVIFSIDDAIRSKHINRSEIEDKLTEIETFTEYMSNTIEDFRNFVSKDKEKERFNLSQTIKESLKILKTMISSYEINIDLKLEDSIIIEGYKSEFQQIFLIFINNSKDAFTLKDISDKKILISSKILDKKILIEVEDNAGGIEKEHINKIFNAYYSSKENGIGLGLHINKMIIEKIGGQIKIENTQKGAKFSIILNLIKP